jgi:hypothetical protein
VIRDGSFGVHAKADDLQFDVLPVAAAAGGVR